MTNEEMVKALIEYGNTRYPKIDCERTKGKAGISFKEFIESLAYTTQK